MRLHTVIPTHNAPVDRLSRAVASALACAPIDQVWVIDDGSSPPVPPSGLLQHERVSIIRQENAGPSCARNAGLHRAVSADAVLLLDDDDEVIPDGIDSMLALGTQLKSSAVVAARVHVNASTGETLTKPVPVDWSDRALPTPGDIFTPIGLFGASGCLVMKPAIDVRFDPLLWIGEDRDFLRKCAEIAPVGVCSRAAVRVTIHPQNRSNLSGIDHHQRRVADHLTLLQRYYEPSHDAQWRESTLWLVNQIAKHGGADPTDLLAACAQRGWKLPLKTRWRLARRGGRP